MAGNEEAEGTKGYKVAGVMAIPRVDTSFKPKGRSIGIVGLVHGAIDRFLQESEAAESQERLGNRPRRRNDSKLTKVGCRTI